MTQPLAKRLVNESRIGSILPEPSGGDDTAAINAHLAAYGGSGRLVRGIPGSSYKTTAPIIIPGGTSLDVSDCTFTLQSGSNCNMVQNKAYADGKRAIDGAVTSGSKNLVATPRNGAGFNTTWTSGDVGKRILVARAGASGADHVTTIESVTNGTTVVLAAAAASTVTHAYVHVGVRDAPIALTGGTYDRGGNGQTSGAQGFTANSIMFRHVDGLTVRRTAYKSTVGKYAIGVADCTNVLADDLNFVSTYSDGIHFNGPCDRVTVRNVRGGYMYDDVVSFTATDSVITMSDTSGDITNVTVDDVKLANGDTYPACLKVVAGKTPDSSYDFKVIGMRATNLIGACPRAVVALGDETGGVYDDITVRGVRSLAPVPGKQAVFIAGGTWKRLTLDDICGAPADLAAVQVGGTGFNLTIENLTINGLRHDTTQNSGGAVQVAGGTTTVDNLTISNANVKTTATGRSILALNQGTGGTVPTIRRARLANIDFAVTSGSNFTIGVSAGATLERVALSSVHCINVTNPGGIYRGATAITAHNVTSEGGGEWVRATGASAAVDIIAWSGLNTTYPDVTVDGGATLRSRAAGLTAKVDKLAKNNGDQAYNTNASLSCGVGPVVCNGTNWKNVYTGSTY